MLELSFVILGIFLLVVLGSLRDIVPPVLFVEVGLWLLVLGLLEGVPTGLYYHLVLYRILGPRGKLPPRWWILPQRYHAFLDEKEYSEVRRWFLLGGVGFFFAVVGGVMAFIGVVAGLQQTPNSGR
jgi:hypothetical protein